MLLAHDKIGSVTGRQLKAVPVRNRIRGTRLDTISTENAAVVVDIVNLGVTLGATDPILRCIIGRFDVNAIGRAVGRAEKAGNALFQTILVALQHVRATVTGLNASSPQRPFAIRVIFHDRRPD